MFDNSYKKYLNRSGERWWPCSVPLFRDGSTGGGGGGGVVCVFVVVWAVCVYCVCVFVCVLETKALPQEHFFTKFLCCYYY